MASAPAAQAACIQQVARYPLRAWVESTDDAILNQSGAVWPKPCGTTLSSEQGKSLTGGARPAMAHRPNRPDRLATLPPSTAMSTSHREQASWHVYCVESS